VSIEEIRTIVSEIQCPPFTIEVGQDDGTCVRIVVSQVVADAKWWRMLMMVG
jgi:hypothetical protein